MGNLEWLPTTSLKQNLIVFAVINQGILFIFSSVQKILPSTHNLCFEKNEINYYFKYLNDIVSVPMNPLQ